MREAEVVREANLGFLQRRVCGGASKEHKLPRNGGTFLPVNAPDRAPVVSVLLASDQPIRPTV
ncbi:hypothetical protein YC2023_075283 [Brassica napus]